MLFAPCIFFLVLNSEPKAENLYWANLLAKYFASATPEAKKNNQNVHFPQQGRHMQHKEEARSNRKADFTVKAMLDLPQQQTVVVHLRSEL